MEQDNEYTEFVKGLIDAVREEPCIYDKKHIFYFNKFEKEKSWYKIAEQLGRSVEDCQKRWKLLRERLAKELKKRERAFVNEQTFQSEWSCFDKIVFIEDHIVRRRRHHPYSSSLSNDFHDKLVHTLSDSNQSSASSSFTNDIHHYWQKSQLRRADQVLQKHCANQISTKIVRQRNANPTNNINDRSGSNNGKNSSGEINNKHEITSNLRLDATVHQDIKIEHDEMIDLDSDSDNYDIVYESEGVTDSNGAVKISQSSNCKVLSRHHQSIHRDQDHDQSVTLPTSTTIVDENEVKINNFTTKAAQGTDSNSNGAEDSDILFGKMVTAMLKEIPHEVHKDNAKVYIMQMLIKAKCERN